EVKQCTCRELCAQQIGHCLKRQLVTKDDASVEAVTITFAKQRLANIVRPSDEFDIFSMHDPPGNRVIIFHESRTVAFAYIGQHAKKMMAAQAHSHRFVSGLRRCFENCSTERRLNERADEEWRYAKRNGLFNADSACKPRCTQCEAEKVCSEKRYESKASAFAVPAAFCQIACHGCDDRKRDEI